MKNKKYDKPSYLRATLLELIELHLYETFYNVLKPSFKDLQVHSMKTDSFIKKYTEVNISEKYMNLSNLDIPMKTNNKETCKVKNEIGIKIIVEFIVLLTKTYSFKYYDAKENRIKKINKATHEDHYNARMYNKERTVIENRIQKIWKYIVTVNTTKIRLNSFDAKRFQIPSEEF